MLLTCNIITTPKAFATGLIIYPRRVFSLRYNSMEVDVLKQAESFEVICHKSNFNNKEVAFHGQCKVHLCETEYCIKDLDLEIKNIDHSNCLSPFRMCNVCAQFSMMALTHLS